MTDDELLDWIEAFLAAHRYAPSVRELMEACGYTSVSTMHFRLARLQRQGRLTTKAQQPRTVAVVR